jgi:hypothetical protein
VIRKRKAISKNQTSKINNLSSVASAKEDRKSNQIKPSRSSRLSGEAFFLPTEEELAAELKREVPALECCILHL